MQQKQSILKAHKGSLLPILLFLLSWSIISCNQLSGTMRTPMQGGEQPNPEEEKKVPLAAVRSTACNNLLIDQDRWAVSIMRKPTGQNPEHAFLIVEGITPSGQGILRRYDLFTDQNKASQGLVKIKEELVAPKDIEKLLKEFLKGESFYCQTWSITRGQAQHLHQDVLADQAKSIPYFILGNKNVFAKSTPAPSTQGHNCFTWAREKLHKLNDGAIQLPPKCIDYIAAQTSRYLKAPRRQGGGECVLL